MCQNPQVEIDRPAVAELMVDVAATVARRGAAASEDVHEAIPGAGALTGKAGQASARIRYAAGRVSRSVSSWMSTAIFVRADECCRL
jgi:hypothetical protein